MLKKEITYIDFDGNERTETHYFNLTKTELAEKQMSVEGGLTTKIKRIMEAQNGPEIAELFKDFILMSYGEKSDDGKYFRKGKEISENFVSSMAYDTLFMELISDSQSAVNFLKGILPSDLSGKIDDEMKKEGLKTN